MKKLNEYPPSIEALIRVLSVFVGIAVGVGAVVAFVVFLPAWVLGAFLGLLIIGLAWISVWAEIVDKRERDDREPGRLKN